MKIMVQNEENNKNLTEIDDLKDEKKIIYREKEDIKRDYNELIEKNSKLFKDIENGKQKELELNSIISNYQKDLIQS
mgnify:CR=1 FL=1